MIYPIPYDTLLAGIREHAPRCASCGAEQRPDDDAVIYPHLPWRWQHRACPVLQELPAAA